ncbi:hypothetical protein [Glutamicibacter soli]
MMFDPGRVLRIIPDKHIHGIVFDSATPNVRGARVGVLPTVHNRKRLGQAFTKGGQNFIRQLRRTFWSSAAILR